MKVILQDVCSPKTSNLAQKDLIGLDGDYPVYGASGYIGNINFYHQANKCVAVVKDGAGIGRTMLLPEKSTAIGTMQYLIPKENILPEYLFYAVKNMHLEKYYTGATIPHIYFKDYKNEKFNYADLEQQLCIVNTLKLVEDIISKKTKQLEQLDNLVKALFVEMFGDPMLNAKKWSKIPFHEVIKYANNGMSRRGNDKNGSIVLRLTELQKGYIDYANPNKILLTDIEKEKYLLFNNDLLFARVNGNPMNVGRCAEFIILDEPVYYNDHIIRVRVDAKKLNSCFANILFNSKYGKKELSNKIKTSAGQYTISQDGIGAVQIILPPIKLQEKFADSIKQIDKHKLLIID